MADKNYYTHLRTDVLAMIPEQAHSFLSVGCGNGRTEEQLVKRGDRVVGIEIDQQAAAQARERGIEILEGDATKISDSLVGREFDCLIYADILEHIADPVALMRTHLGSLKPGGCAIISVPNFRNLYVFKQLFVHGHIRYQDSGVLDRTHLRITTRKMVLEWFDEVGLSCDLVDHQIWTRRDRAIVRASFGLLREFYAAQVLLRGVKPAG